MGSSARERRVRHVKSYTADDPVRFVRRIILWSPTRTVLLLVRAGRVLRRDADDLHPGTPGDVHGVDHLSVLHLRVTLHEDDLLGPAVVDLLEPGSEAILGDLLGVDAVGAIREH